MCACVCVCVRARVCVCVYNLKSHKWMHRLLPTIASNVILYIVYNIFSISAVNTIHVYGIHLPTNANNVIVYNIFNISAVYIPCIHLQTNAITICA